jgi:hypothetical protein
MSTISGHASVYVPAAGGAPAPGARGLFGSFSYTSPSLAAMPMSGGSGVVYDDASFFDLVNSQLVIPSDGDYIYAIRVTCRSNTTGYLATSVSSAYDASGERVSFPSVPYEYAMLVGGPRRLKAGDTISFMLQASSSGTYSLDIVTIRKL